MSVRIIKSDERLIHQIGDTKFYYKRISSDRASAVRRKYTVRGEVDGGKVGFDILETHLLGWENVLDWDDKPVPFSVENIRLIPDEVLGEIITAIGSADGTLARTVEQAVSKQDKTEKNS